MSGMLKTTVQAGFHCLIFTTIIDNTHTILNRKLLHLSTVVTFQNVNVPVHCQSLLSSTFIDNVMSLTIMVGITGLFCEYSKLL